MIKDIILDILGLFMFGLAVYGFYFMEVGIKESGFVAFLGLSMFVLKGSQVRKFFTSIIKKISEKNI